MDENKKPTNNKRFLAIYCVAIFLFASVLIVFSAISNAKLSREADAITILHEEATTRLDAVIAENTKLSEQIKELEIKGATLTTEKTALADENAKLKESLKASQELCSLLDTKRTKTKSQFNKALKLFEAAGYPTLLSEAELKIYNSIK